MHSKDNPGALIDTHAHIYDKRFDGDFEEMIRRAVEAGVGTVIAPATEPGDFPALERLQKEYKQVEVAVGVHPHSAAKVEDADIERLPETAERCNAIAIGEIGLDYYYDFAPKDRQQDVFRRQLRIAKELGLPAVIHNRESDEDVLRILEEEQDGRLRFQLHCFSSGPDVLERSLDLGGMISFTGNITFKKSTLDEVVRRVPDDRLMIETDSPYMTPVPNRGKRNEPSFVGLVAEKIAEIRTTTPEKVFQMTTQNARRFFALSLILASILLSGVGTLYAQRGEGAEPVAEVDTVEHEPYDRFIGIGPHMAATTFIVNRATQANTLSLGGWLTISPLQPIDVRWLQLDLLYTPTSTTPGLDDVTRRILDNSNAEAPAEFSNTHNTFNAWLRFVPNPKAKISFHLSFGYTYFFNSYGIDKFIIEENLAPDDPAFMNGFEESTWGLGGGLGLSVHFDTDFGLFVPTAELTYSSIVGDRDLPRYDGGFGISQARLGLLYYPPLSEMLGL